MINAYVMDLAKDRFRARLWRDFLSLRQAYIIRSLKI